MDGSCGEIDRMEGSGCQKVELKEIVGSRNYEIQSWAMLGNGDPHPLRENR